MAEFTGERAVPGQISPDLWNEHVVRYAFAARSADGARVLDAGCGAGYGTAMLAATANWAVGVDAAAEAVAYAREHYQRANAAFVRADCTALPFASASFDLVVAFELIEHVAEWERALGELRRVLAPEGLCLLSTPNRLYYTESRGAAGRNPFHHREFDWRELSAALAQWFPWVFLYVENHLPGVAIVPVGTAPLEARLEQPCPDPAEANFLLAACGLRERIPPPGLWWAPRAANVLWEREKHIRALEQELAQKEGWLEEAREEKQKLLEMFRFQTAELERSNRWAASLDEELGRARGRIAALQQELAEHQEAARRAVAGYQAKVAELEAELDRRTQWALDTERRLQQELETARAELERRSQELAECVRLLDRAEATVVERTEWAQRLDARVRELEQQVAAFRASRWVRLGRLAGFGPRQQWES